MSSTGWACITFMAFIASLILAGHMDRASRDARFNVCVESGGQWVTGFGEPQCLKPGAQP